MAIDIPKPIEPQQAPLAQLQAQAASAVSVDFRQTHLHVFGDLPIGPRELQAAMDRSSNLSDAVRGIAAECYIAGYPATMLYYAATDTDVWVQVRRGRVDKVQAPPPYDRYFDHLGDGKVLTESRLEPARTLASVQADRAGLQGQIQLRPDGPDTVILIIDPAAPGPKSTDLRLDIGNPGNRFFGRDLIDASVRHSDAYGDEFRFTTIAGFRGLGLERERNGPFHEQDASVTRVSSLGIFDTDVRYSDFRIPLFLQGAANIPGATAGTFRETSNNDLLVAGAAWLLPAYIDFTRRLTVQVRGDYTLRTSHLRVDNANPPGSDSVQVAGGVLQGDQTLLDEKYPSVEASLAYSQAIHTGWASYFVDASALVRKGLRSRRYGVGGAALDYLVERPAFQLAAQPGDHLYFLLSGQAQFSGSDTMPEEQQWVLGGIGNVYAYLPGAAIGDKGWLGRVEGQYRHLDFEPAHFTPRVFVEYGTARSNNPAVSGVRNIQALADVGGALDVEVWSWLEASVSAAVDIHHSNVSAVTRNDSQSNYFFRVSAKY